MTKYVPFFIILSYSVAWGIVMEFRPSWRALLMTVAFATIAYISTLLPL